jgi:hypothetical protein
MPAKLRAAKERRPSFAPGVLELFAELERTPLPRRRTQDFTNRSKRLAALLGLTDEWWAMQHVEDRGKFRPPASLVAHHYWLTVQRVRRELLAATGLDSVRPH